MFAASATAPFTFDVANVDSYPTHVSPPVDDPICDELPPLQLSILGSESIAAAAEAGAATVEETESAPSRSDGEGGSMEWSCTLARRGVRISPRSSSCTSSTTFDDLSDDALVYMLLFLCPSVYGGDPSLQDDLNAEVVQQIMLWPKEALVIALTCKRMYRLLFLDPNNDTIFWQWYCFTYLRSISTRENPPHDQFIQRPMTYIQETYHGYPDYAKRGVVDRTRAKFMIPEHLHRIAPARSEEQQQQPNYYRLLTIRHHKLHEKLCRDLQRRENSRYRKYKLNMLIKDRIKRPVLQILFTAIFLSCLLFYSLQTLHGFLHWLLMDMLQLSWFELPSRILLHISWLPAWFTIALFFILTTLMALYCMITRPKQDLLSFLVAVCVLKVILFAIFITLLLLYLAIVLPKRSGDPTWLQPEYIPWNVIVAPLILILLPVSVISISLQIKKLLSEYRDYRSVRKAIKYTVYWWFLLFISVSLVIVFLMLAPLAQTFIYDALWWRWVSMFTVHIPLLIAEIIAIVVFSVHYYNHLKMIADVWQEHKTNHSYYILSIIIPLSLIITHFFTIATASWWCLIPAALPTACVYLLIMISI